jgi:hypothetical protein
MMDLAEKSRPSALQVGAKFAGQLPQVFHSFLESETRQEDLICKLHQFLSVLESIHFLNFECKLQKKLPRYDPVSNLINQ